HPLYKAPPPPPDHPPSLPDALPISTLPLPPALATGTAAVFWNPAQIEDSARTQLGLEGIEMPAAVGASGMIAAVRVRAGSVGQIDRKSKRLNSSHDQISYAVFCLKK